MSTRPVVVRVPDIFTEPKGYHAMTTWEGLTLEGLGFRVRA